MDKIVIKDLLVQGIVGINDWERAQPQDILVNIEINIELHKASAKDSLEESIDYNAIGERIISYAKNETRLTVEALAADIAALCLEEPLALAVRVRVEKPGALRFARSVGVEIERSKKQ